MMRLAVNGRLLAGAELEPMAPAMLELAGPEVDMTKLATLELVVPGAHDMVLFPYCRRWWSF